MNRRTLRANILLILAAMFWGSTFVAQSIGADYLDPFSFQGIRCIAGALLLLPVIAVFDKIGEKGTWQDKNLWIGGCVCGLVLFASTNLQQFGLSLGTTAGKSGFITALYIVMVPMFGLLLKKRPSLWVWPSVALAVLGLYLLCMDESFRLTLGDAMTLLCALCFSIHIMVVDHFSPNVDPIRLSCVQFLVCGILSLIAMVFAGIPTWKAVADCWLPLGYAAVFSCAAAYTFQIVAQRDTNPTVASLLMSLESVFACLSGWVVLQERLSTKEALGCLIMFCAVILAQLPDKKEKNSSKESVSMKE